MKRSQAIESLLETSRTFHGESVQDPTFERRLVEALLKKCEDIGMSPPWIMHSSVGALQDWDKEDDEDLYVGPY